MKLVCGLGNPGAKYCNTRHNVGFAVCDRIAVVLGVSFDKAKFSSEVAEGRVAGDRVLLLKPQTFMNRSGRAVAPAMQFFKLGQDQLLVVQDDADLAAGELRIKQGGGTAGHKGLNSLRDSLGHTDFDRLRFGVGRPDDSRIELSDFVLTKLAEDEKEFFEQRYAVAARAVMMWLTEGAAAAMNEFNGRA